MAKKPTSKPPKKRHGERGKDKFNVAPYVARTVIVPVPRRTRSDKGKPRPDAQLTPKMVEKQWKPGQSGNPNGRRKSYNEVLISKSYLNTLREQCDIPGMEGLTWAEAIAFGLARAASLGDTQAAKEIRESTEGKLPEHLKLSDPNGRPLNQVPPVINVSFVDPKEKS